jgi:hypothetical protein
MLLLSCLVSFCVLSGWLAECHVYDVVDKVLTAQRAIGLMLHPLFRALQMQTVQFVAFETNHLLVGTQLLQANRAV